MKSLLVGLILGALVLTASAPLAIILLAWLLWPPTAGTYQPER